MSNTKQDKKPVKRPATFGEAVASILGMAIIIAVGYIGFGLRVEPLMICSAILAAFLAKRLGFKWSELEEGVCQKLIQATPAILIMWTIGMVIGTFMYSGSIPMIIYYGLMIINPQYLYVCAFLVCIILSTVTGTSWGSAGTIGVAMMGVAAGLGVPLHITAAAVVCGAIFGDKLSPLSETTNLAPLCAGTGLYKHIGSMLWTTIPATIISFFVFFFAGFTIQIESSELPESAVNTMNILNEMYDWNIVMLIPFIIILVCAFTKQPPVPTMVGASFAAIAIGAITQGFDLASGVAASVNGFTVDMIYDSEVTSEVAGLLNRGGMKSMVGIIIVIYCGYVYAAIISKAGFLETALRPVIKRANSRVSVVTAALATDFIILCCAGSSYVAHIMVGEMYKKSFIKNGMDLRVLSRSMEDVGTMMAPLIPWGASGAFYIATLGVPIFGEGGFAPWAFNTWLNPIIAIILAATGIGMYKLTKEQQDEELAKLEAEENIL